MQFPMHFVKGRGAQAEIGVRASRAARGENVNPCTRIEKATTKKVIESRVSLKADGLREARGDENTV
jgi:hypothetical protein